MSSEASHAPAPDTGPDPVDSVVAELCAALEKDFGTPLLPAPAGWVLACVEPRDFRRRVPVVELRHGDQRLCFIVTRTDPREPAYKRTARHDVTYFSEDVPDEEQDKIYRRDREMIETFARWLSNRDGPAKSPR